MPLPAWAISVIGFVREHARQVLAAGGTLVALLIAIWWFASVRGASTPPRAEPAKTSLRMHDNQATPSSPQWLPPTLGSDELCGYGPLPAPEEIPKVQAHLEAEAALALHRLAADLAAGSTDRDRAFGMYLQMLESRGEAATAWSRAHGNCADTDTACFSDLAGAWAVGGTEYQRALVRLATSTSDAEAYALAMYSCPPSAGQSSIADCAQLSYGQWARLEPENAVPWLYLAAEAERRHDRSGLEAALYRASKSGFSDTHGDAISRLFGSQTYEAQPPPVQIQLAFQLLGIQNTIWMPPIQVPAQYCRTAAKSASSDQICSDLAAVLVEHSRTLMEVFIGGRIAEKVGWTDPRLSGLRDEADALRWQMSNPAESAEKDILASCESLRRFHLDMATRAQLGEAARFRLELAHRGVSTSEAAGRWRAEAQRRATEQASTSEETK